MPWLSRLRDIHGEMEMRGGRIGITGAPDRRDAVAAPHRLPFVQSGRVAIQMRVGSGLIDQSQKMTVAARATAEKKAFGHRS